MEITIHCVAASLARSVIKDLDMELDSDLKIILDLDLAVAGLDTSLGKDAEPEMLK